MGAKDKNGKIRSLYEPVHGSAPDIAGKNISKSNSYNFKFIYGFEIFIRFDKEADQLDKAVQSVR